jgi:hypothetical protein
VLTSHQSLRSIAAAKFASYSQLEVVRTAMLSRHVKTGGARVFMAGGTTRDLFYFPQGTVQVAVAAPDLKTPFWEQAGMQAGVPVRGIEAMPGAALAASAGAAYDSVVLFDALGGGENLQKMMDEAWRALKPGGTLIFYQRTSSGSPLAAAVRLGGSGGAAAGKIYFNRFNISFLTAHTNFFLHTDPQIGDAVAAAREWDFSQWDEAAGALDPHAVGVAIKPLTATDDCFSADTSTFIEVMKGEQRRKKKGGGGGDKKGFGGSTQ